MTNYKILFLAMLIPWVAKALVAPDGAMALTDPSGSLGLDWDYVVNFNGSSAVAIDSYWLLTAAHVADDAGHSSVVVDGVTYNQVGEVYHATADLALIQLDAPLPGYYDIYTGSYPTGGHSKPEVAMVGYGGVGTITPTTNYTVSSIGKGTKRWATNKIDGTLNYVGGTGKTNDGFVMGFNTTDSTNEGGVGIGDSGGAIFYEDGGVWKLAGIMTDAATAGTSDAIYAANIQEYETWIVAVIPEASPFILVGGVMGMLLLVQRIRSPLTPHGER